MKKINAVMLALAVILCSAAVQGSVKAIEYIPLLNTADLECYSLDSTANIDEYNRDCFYQTDSGSIAASSYGTEKTALFTDTDTVSDFKADIDIRFGPSGKTRMGLAFGLDKDLGFSGTDGYMIQLSNMFSSSEYDNSYFRLLLFKDPTVWSVKKATTVSNQFFSDLKRTGGDGAELCDTSYVDVTMHVSLVGNVFNAYATRLKDDGTTITSEKIVSYNLPTGYSGGAIGLKVSGSGIVEIKKSEISVPDDGSVITYESTTNGTVSGAFKAHKGNTVRTVVKPDNGYRFKNLVINGVPLANGITTFKKESGNMSVSAEFTIDNSENINIDELQNGSITVNSNFCEAGNRAEVTVIPDAGYKLKYGSLRFLNTASGKYTAINERCKPSENVFSFVMPSCAVIVTADFIPESEINLSVLSSDASDGTLIFNNRICRSFAGKSLESAGAFIIEANGAYSGMVNSVSPLGGEDVSVLKKAAADGEITLKQTRMRMLSDRTADYIDFKLKISNAIADSDKVYTAVAYGVYSGGAVIYSAPLSSSYLDALNTPDEPGILLTDGAYYKISLMSDSNTVLAADGFGVENGANAVLEPYAENLNQLWRARLNVDGSYCLENLSAGRFLSVKSDSINSGSSVTVNGETADGYIQSFSVTNDGKIHIPSSDSVIQPENRKTLPYTPIVCMGEDGISAQCFRFSQLDDGTTELPRLARFSGDMRNWSTPELYYDNERYYSYIMYPGIAVKNADTKGALLKDAKEIIWEYTGNILGSKISGTNVYYDYQTAISGGNLCAPGVYKIGDTYCAYYSVSANGKQTSMICLSTNTTLDPFDPEYNWQDRGIVIKSNTGDSYNALDPAVIIDTDGEPWLLWGSYWNGIYITRINSTTFKPNTDGQQYNIAKRGDVADKTYYRCDNGSIEAPYIINHNGYYYLFMAEGRLASVYGYHGAICRSTSLTGGFKDSYGFAVDAKAKIDGVTKYYGSRTFVTEDKGLSSNGVINAAHASVFKDRDGTFYYVTEYFNENSKQSRGLASSIVWDEDGWPVTALSANVLSRMKGAK